MNDTPATRTGPPRSVSFITAASPAFVTHSADPELSFRGALEYPSPNKGKTRIDKRRSSTEESWNPKRWFHEPPKDLQESGLSADETFPTTRAAPRRTFSAPHSPTERPSHKEKHTSRGREKWAKLRSLLPYILYSNQPILPDPSVVTSPAVNITDELITGGLSMLMLRLWFERDEKGHRRVPVLFHRLRIRVSDSLHPLQQHKSVFRIECEYANGAARWVIYRELRDFISLHTHYTVSSVYKRTKEEFPEFPMTSTSLTSIPYFYAAYHFFL